jgi:hypothetical protein
MPNLFPTEEVSAEVPSTESNQIQFGKSWRFNFKTGEFIVSPTGKVNESDGTGAWVEWCQKALLTPRYRHLIYDPDYGQDYEDLIGRGLTREAVESEIKRITIETLTIDPRTASVQNFTFDWQNDQVFFECEISNVLGESAKIEGSMVSG